MGQSPSSVRSKSSRRSFRGFVRRTKLNKSSLSHTFNLPPSEEYPELMNVNTATEEQLMTLPGVTRQLAREIVRHRQMIGRFKRVDDLALVSGIGAEKLELLRPDICTNTRRQISRASSCTHSLDSVRFTGENKLCSINSSSVFQLQCVPGLNQEIAANIVDYRNKKGPFKSLDDLIKVRGMDIVRLSTVKHHLSLEPRKCESVQLLANGHTFGWNDDSFNEPSLNDVPEVRTPHRKSLSMPTKLPITLPNGFATAPVNDILDLLAAYSHRPVVEELFTYERDGIKCCRLASWNLHQLSIEKITNPGVREVICRTILENKLSIIAIQDVLEPAALKVICEELNSPALRRVREWRCNSHKWDYCANDRTDGPSLGFIYEASHKSVTVEDVSVDQLHLLSEATDARRLSEALTALRTEDCLASPQVFLICGRPVIVVNVQCRGPLAGEQCARLDGVAALALDCKLPLFFAGDFHRWDNVHLLKNCESVLDESVPTKVDAASDGHCAILAAGGVASSGCNGHAAAIRSGLSHLAIPRGWSWGGPASPHCPLWTELNVPD
ncbi:PREDICTED: endonuclease/exonuclease/phosphatase family domain-containing protein 1-like [Papilio polytes]|uniref:endonuclease/exonuclease/phosphatase family domain-containing protein 1-like n=1 Tax=Papilio polytes TaxID=76194 RepID=UPI000675FE28|nr:PREDICTED: endonuclease/exonuclease/phosphatase family domain-containing protein 1-like [Papilio polytes]